MPRTKRYERRKAEGRCGRCGADELASDTLCTGCLEQKRENNRERRARRKGAGECVDCGDDAYAGWVRCQGCHETKLRREYRARLQERMKRSRSAMIEHFGEEGARDFMRRLRDAIQQ